MLKCYDLKAESADVSGASPATVKPSGSPVYTFEGVARTPSMHSSTLRRFRRGARFQGGGSVNFARLLRGRETDSSSVGTAFERASQVTAEMVRRLGLQAELTGHTGCVNCLEWNHDGSLLASGSDDVSVIIWEPMRGRKLRKIRTGHTGNIFSVKFLPESNDNVIVTGAADYKVRVHDLSTSPSSSSGSDGSVFNGASAQVFSCHAGRVKRLATAPGLPHVFWSGAEDGLVMEFDLRNPELSNATHPKNVLINLNHHLGLNAEVKCLSVNPLRPHLLAVGANDPFVRVFDRRMLTCSSVKYPNGSQGQGHDAERSSSRYPAPLEQRHALLNHLLSEEGDLLTPESAQFFVAGHLPIKQEDYRRRYRQLASTYLTFSPDGTELLANLGGEQLYLFDLNESDRPKRLDLTAFAGSWNRSVTVEKSKESEESDRSTTESDSGTESEESAATDVKRSRLTSSRESESNQTQPMAPQVESLKEKGNQAFNRQHYSSAISLYNEALSVDSASAILYANRAAALMKRGWDGDLYAALRDCHTALKGESLPSVKCKAHFRLAKCLYELQWTREALDCLARFKLDFPEHAAKEPCETLERDIKAAIFARTGKDKDGGGDDDDDDEEDEPSLEKMRKKKSRRNGRRSPPGGYRLSEKEKNWRASSKDYKLRFAGHCNTTTDIKEANFFGSNGQFILAGSDDGSFFVWDRSTTNIARVLRGDDSIVNCIQPHPSCCLLASSGIDPVVRLWSPRPDDGIKDEREVSDSDDAAFANQRRMNADPLEVMLMNMGYRVRGDEDDDNDDEEEEGSAEGGRAHVVCPTS